MVIQRKLNKNKDYDAQFALNITSKSVKFISDFLNVETDTAKSIKDNDSWNNRILIRTPYNTKNIIALSINDYYMDSKLYSNGHPRVSSEFRILFTNFIEQLNLDDILVLCAMVNENLELDFQTVYDLYKSTTKKSRELYYYLFNSDGCNYDVSELHKYQRSRSINTHFYTEYNGLDEFKSVFNEQVLFPLTKLVKCEYTDKIFQINKRNVVGELCYYVSGGEYIDSDYYDNNFQCCDSCSNDFHQEDLFYCEDEDEMYCERCTDNYNDDRISDSIHSYSYKPSPIFFHNDAKKSKLDSNSIPLKDTLYLGLELEIEARDSSVNMQVDANEINGLYNGLFYCKSDSSISDVNDGFEIVSHPITFNGIKSLDLDKTLCNYSNYYKSFYSRNCGMHIHLSRKSFNDIQLYKFVLMMNQYQSLVHLVSQRRRLSEYDSWCAFNKSTSDNVKNRAYHNIKNQKENASYISANGTSRKTKLKFQTDVRVGGRYQVVNMQNYATIEVRSFKGNLKYEGFMKNVEFVHSMFYFCKSTSLQDLNVKSFIDFVQRDSNSYKNLIKFFDDNKSQLKKIIQNPNEII